MISHQSYTSRAYVKQLRQQKILLDDLEKQQFKILTRLLKFVRYPLTMPSLGRVLVQNVGVIYWPYQSSISLRNLRRDLYPDDLCARDCASLGITAPDDAYLLRRLKELAEQALKPVLLSPYTRSARQRFWQLGMALDRITGTSSQKTDTGRFDPTNYTLFRRYIAAPKTFRRLYTPHIPKDTDLFADCLPEHFKVLQEAWEALATRSETAFDNIEAGIDYLPSGLIAINWLRYVRVLSKGEIPGTQARHPEPRKLVAQFEAASRALGGFIAARRGTGFFDTLLKQAIAFELGAPDDEPFFSFFDPYAAYSGKHAHLFKGQWHYHNTNLRKQKREAIRKGLRQRDPRYVPRAVPITFKPADYIKRELEQGVFTAWFGADHQELIYTVKSRKAICFKRPALLSEAIARFPTETEMWKRVLDTFRVIEVVDANAQGVPTRLEPSMMKSDFFRQARESYLEKAARELYHDFESLDQLRASEMKAVKRKAQQTYVREQAAAGQADTRWYHDGVLKQVMAGPAMVDIRTQMRVRLSADVEPTQETFFRPMAIKMFLKMLEPPTGFTTTTQDETTRASLNNAWRPAPYVLAWARFCDKVISDVSLFKREFRTADESEVTRQWTPHEDLAVLMSYHAYPTMTREEWRTLLSKLSDRTQEQTLQRIVRLRTVLKRVLPGPSVRLIWPGACADDARRARQAVLIFGLASKLKLRNCNDNEIVRRVMRLSSDRIATISLPGVYAVDFFRNFKP